ncbi:MAG TPA: hypothetical protein VIO58_04145 [Candidatus Methanoperedens sp.]
MPKPCGFSTPRTRMPCGAYVDTPERGVTLGVFICGSFSSDPKAINRIFFRSYHCVFLQNGNKRLSAVRSVAQPHRHRARHPIRDAAGSHTEGGAPGEWARYRLGEYTIIERIYNN